MTGFSRRTRRLLIGLTLLLSLSATPRPAEAAGTPEECLMILGSFCFMIGAACDSNFFIPSSGCDRIFLSCARAAVQFCFKT